MWFCFKINLGKIVKINGLFAVAQQTGDDEVGNKMYDIKFN